MGNKNTITQYKKDMSIQNENSESKRKKQVFTGRNFVIRKAAKEDLPELERIFQAAYKGLEYCAYRKKDSTLQARHNYCRNYLLWALQKPVGIFVGEINNIGIFGFTVLHLHKNFGTAGIKNAFTNKAEVVELAIDPRWQGYGFGKKIYSFAEQHAKRYGYKKIIAEIAPQNTPALKLFKNNGFATVSWHRDWTKWLRLEKIIKN